MVRQYIVYMRVEQLPAHGIERAAVRAWHLRARAAGFCPEAGHQVSVTAGANRIQIMGAVREAPVIAGPRGQVLHVAPRPRAAAKAPTFTI